MLRCRPQSSAFGDVDGEGRCTGTAIVHAQGSAVSAVAVVRGLRVNQLQLLQLQLLQLQLLQLQLLQLQLQ
jgi:hypothetical protein